ncbi:hypothetical protein A3K34_02535 [candidate division WWE3 bacterium RIFOXYC1_FULL_40_10]|uniref:Uncharacterized protein n=1 Tax=candidate division WWE3 bacterium RIFOXYA2_FULL_46_9 TaxID=1802636 RepID=A0A1F4W2V9_UNCKA|nr:MAG: hypothetical protein A3K58_02535 [candidate division WWE3 bacterium RIFOXYB1_FULL_40_22]OGC61726.1 MAG: hypothetical protein A3K37_02535 [candidate division WWE3 bacterium RIFOXYA1_FULL_40_11]OGC63710.1 MAG: hypothetical protein A2264_05025 [candidate division WWE3 bacterium RIFOXYA2_FULL_46_9]OGC65117.1 MAG: hypothetical protein A2326_00960 [candidate division WWE3 bacterium RIFOXYB2_FULL_41_6]OGC66109.1 MAG: hypothetical protein A3K34_02535 [candidate division WWE3 bacterium RIFOXYC1_
MLHIIGHDWLAVACDQTDWTREALANSIAEHFDTIAGKSFEEVCSDILEDRSRRFELVDFLKNSIDQLKATPRCRILSTLELKSGGTLVFLCFGKQITRDRIVETIVEAGYKTHLVTKDHDLNFLPEEGIGVVMLRGLLDTPDTLLLDKLDWSEASGSEVFKWVREQSTSGISGHYTTEEERKLLRKYLFLH